LYRYFTKTLNMWDASELKRSSMDNGLGGPHQFMNSLLLVRQQAVAMLGPNHLQRIVYLAPSIGQTIEPDASRQDDGENRQTSTVAPRINQAA